MEIRKFRNHISMVFEQIWSFLLVIALLILQNIQEVSEGVKAVREGTAMGAMSPGRALLSIGVLILLIFIVAIQIAVWSKTWITLDGSTLIWEKDTIIKKKNTISLQNISNVNIEQNFFEKILNTCQVKLDTGSLSTANETDIKIILKRPQALELKEFLLQVTEGEQNVVPSTGQVVNSDSETSTASDITSQQTRNHKQILWHGICSINITTIWILIAGIVGVVELVKTPGNIFQSTSATITNIIVLGGILYACIKGIFGSFITYRSFKANRVQDKIQVHYGLFRTYDFSIPVSQINGVIIRQTFIARCLKRYMVEVINVGMGDDEKEGGSHIILASTKDEVKLKMKELLPEYDVEGIEQLQRQPSMIMKFNMVKLAVFAILAVMIGAMLCWGTESVSPWIIWGVDVVLIALVTATVVLSYYTRASCVSGDALVVCNGSFERKITIMKMSKIQYVTVNSNKILLPHNIARGTAFVLAGIGNQTQTIPYGDKESLELMAREGLINAQNGI